MTIFMVSFLLLAFSDITNTFLLIYQLGACCIYVVFVADNIKALADHLLEKDNDIRLFMLIILLPLILINWVGLHRKLPNSKFEENVKWQLFLRPIGSKFEVFGTIFERSKCHYNSIIWHYLLLHVQWASHNYWQACLWKSGWISIFLWYSAFCTRSDWRCKFIFFDSTMKKVLHLFISFVPLRFYSDNAAGKWNENTKIVWWKFWSFKSIDDCNYLLVRWHGFLRIFEIWRAHCRINNVEFTARWTVRISLVLTFENRLCLYYAELKRTESTHFGRFRVAIRVLFIAV